MTADDRSDRFTVDGLIGGRRVTKIVTGRAEADRQADRFRSQGGSDVGWTREGWTTLGSGGRKAVHVRGYAKKDGTQVRGYTQNRDAAKGEWDTKKWQAATAGASVAIALAVGLATILGLVSEIVFAILLLALLGLNAAVRALTNPRPKPATGRKRTTTTRRVVRRRGPARKTVRRR